MPSPSVQKLIDLFSKFPTIGPRTASRFVFYLIKLPKKEIKDLINSIAILSSQVKLCSFCFNPFEDQGNLCKICSNQNRDTSLLCIIEKEADLLSIEKTRKYKGRYFILGGTISGFKKANLENLRIKELKERISNPKKFNINPLKEIIIAINPTVEGEATSLYLERLLEPFKIKMTRLGRGLPLGAELEYADGKTLEEALETRK